MSNYQKLYWLSRLDNINTLFLNLMIIGGIILLILGAYRLFMFIDGDDDHMKKPWRWFTGFSFFVIGAMGTVFIPTKNEAIFIVAGGKVMNFAEKDTSLNKIPSQTTAILSTWLESETKKIKQGIDNEINDKKDKK